MISRIELLTAQKTELNRDITPHLLLDWQMERIRETISYAKKRSMFYGKRLAAVSESEIRSYKDMASVPFTTQQDVVMSSNDFICVPEKDIARIRTFKTSGTTDDVKRIYFTEKDIERTVSFFAHGMSAIASCKERVLIMMSDERPGSIADLLRKALDRAGIASKIHGHISDAEAAAADAANAECIVGTPSEINFLCVTYPMLRPNSVLLSADYVPASIIAKIKRIWGCKVFTHYGMTETCYGCAVQCSEGSAHHIRHEDMFLEIVDPIDGSQLPPGESGEIVMTVFANEAMPLIRYRTGDIAAIETGTCVCKGILPRLSAVKGRVVNTVRIPGGSSISIEHLDEIMYGIEQLRTYTAEIKRGEKNCAVFLTVDTNGRGHKEEIISRLREYVPRELDIRVNFDAIHPSKGIKKQFILPCADRLKLEK